MPASSPDIPQLHRGLYAAVRAIVLDALSRGEGATLPTNASYCESLSVSAGTVQRAIDLLRDRGALGVVSRGHLGRRIQRVDVGQAWQAAGLDPVRILVPPAGMVEADVLREELLKELTSLGVPYTVYHVNGGAQRLVSLASGNCDLTVVSAATFQNVGSILSAEEFHTHSYRDLGSGTYYGPDRVRVLRRSGDTKRPRRVGIDRASLDHAWMTEAEFPIDQGYEYIPVSFPRSPASVLIGEIDAAIWHRTTTTIPLVLVGIAMEPLKQAALKTGGRDLTSAILVHSVKRGELRSVVSNVKLENLAGMQDLAYEQERLEESHYSPPS